MLPANFEFATKAEDFQARNQFDIWVPIALDLTKLHRGTHSPARNREAETRSHVRPKPKPS